jgi:hypothetical protein
MSVESNTLFVCQCGDVHHQLVISFDPDPSFNDCIWFQIHLSSFSFFGRLKYAIAYLFGQKSDCGAGAFAEILVNKKETTRLIEVLKTHCERMI